MKNKKCLSVLAVMILCMTMLSGCSSKCITRMSVENSNATSYSMKYEYFDGVKEHNITVNEEQVPLTIKVSITSDEGLLGCYIAKDNKTEDAVYSGNDLKTSEFTVTISEQGKYTIHMEAKEHSGSYSFDWE